jgi:hypothetical protein
MNTAFDFLLRLTSSLPGLISAGVEISQMVRDGVTKAQEMKDSGREPTSEEWDWLNGELNRMEGNIQSDEH